MILIFTLGETDWYNQFSNVKGFFFKQKLLGIEADIWMDSLETIVLVMVRGDSDQEQVSDVVNVMVEMNLKAIQKLITRFH